jgi:hypothetical protein
MEIIHKSKISNFHQFSIVINAKLLITINHSIFKFIQKSKLDQDLNFISLILLVKLKYNKDHIYGLNWELAITIKKLNYTTCHPFFCKIHSYRKRKIYHCDFSIRCGAQLAQKSMDEKSSPCVTQRSPLSFISHKMVLVASRS